MVGAANASPEVVDKGSSIARKAFNCERGGGDARTEARKQGFNVDDVPSTHLIDVAGLSAPTVAPPPRGVRGVQTLSPRLQNGSAVPPFGPGLAGMRW